MPLPKGPFGLQYTFTLQDAPPGFLIDPRTGFVQGLADNASSGQTFATRLVASDDTGRQSLPLASYNITIKTNKNK